VSCAACDQITKTIAVANLPDTKVFSYLGDTLRFQLIYNPGAFLSLGSSFPNVFRLSFFIVGNCILLLGVFAFALLSRPGRFRTVLAVSLFFSGGVSNLIDRFSHNGTVVDYINIGIGPVRTGIFNIADIAIMGGCFLFLWDVMRKPRKNS
jgi:signal peptidase II